MHPFAVSQDSAILWSSVRTSVDWDQHTAGALFLLKQLFHIYSKSTIQTRNVQYTLWNISHATLKAESQLNFSVQALERVALY